MKSKKFNTGTWKSDSYNVSMSDFGEKQIELFLDSAIPKNEKSNHVFCSKLQLVFTLIIDTNIKTKKYDFIIWDKQIMRMKK